MKNEDTPFTTTFVIAASDSRNKCGANLVCDSIGDQEEIKEAIDALDNELGGTILLLPGTYIFNDKLEFGGPHNLTLSGYGAVIVPEPYSIAKYAINIHGGYDNLTIAGLTFKGDGTSAHTGGINTFGQGGSSWLIKDCRFLDLYSSAIRINGVDYITITDNFINNIQGYGILVASGSDYAIVSNNIIKRFIANGISVTGSDHVIVESNIVEQTYWNHNCIAVDQGSKYVTIKGNHVSGATGGDQGGIEVERNSEGSDPYAVVIIGNIIRNCNWGIYTNDKVGTGLGHPSYVMINDNLVSGCVIGIYLREGQHISVNDNMFRSNTQDIVKGAGYIKKGGENVEEVVPLKNALG